LVKVLFENYIKWAKIWAHLSNLIEMIYIWFCLYFVILSYSCCMLYSCNGLRMKKWIPLFVVLTRNSMSLTILLSLEFSSLINSVLHIYLDDYCVFVLISRWPCQTSIGTPQHLHESSVTDAEAEVKKANATFKRTRQLLADNKKHIFRKYSFLRV